MNICTQSTGRTTAGTWYGEGVQHVTKTYGRKIQMNTLCTHGETQTPHFFFVPFSPRQIGRALLAEALSACVCPSPVNQFAKDHDARATAVHFPKE